MQLTLAPYLLNITPVLLGLEASPNKKVPRNQKEEFRRRYDSVLQDFLSVQKINEILHNQEPVYLSYKQTPNEYLYWFSLKLSLISRDGIQTALNYANNTYQNLGIFEEIKDHVLPALQKNWKWTSKSVIDEVKVWILLTGPISQSIFSPEIRELLFFHLQPALINQKERKLLFQLLYNNRLPKRAIGLCYNSYKELSIIFSLVKRKSHTILNTKSLAKWLVKNFYINDEEGERKAVKQSAIENYIDSKRPIPDHLKKWF